MLYILDRVVDATNDTEMNRLLKTTCTRLHLYGLHLNHIKVWR